MFFMNMPYANYIMWALTTPVVIIFGQQFFVNAWKQARHRSANMDTLVALSTGIAYLFSVFNTLFLPLYWNSRGFMLMFILKRHQWSLLLFYWENYWKKKQKEILHRL